MNEEINWETMKKIAWVVVVVLLSTATFLFFWKQKHRSGEPGAGLTQTNLTETEEEIEKQKLDQMYARMEDGYVWAIHGQIKSIEAENGTMEIETEQTQTRKIIRVSLGAETDIFKITRKETVKPENQSGNPEEAITEVEESEMKVEKTTLEPGMFVQVKAPEMFPLEKTDSIKAARITFFENQQ